MLKLFMDTEFTGLHKNTTLISLALVSEEGETFYAEFTDYAEDQVDDWIRENVLKHLILDKWLGQYDIPGLTISNSSIKQTLVIGSKEYVASALVAWLDKFRYSFEVWSDCLAYDWVLFCDLFGKAFDIPDNIYYIPFDISTLFRVRGIDPDISREDFAGRSGGMKHNAMHDALVIKACYDKLMLGMNNIL